MMYRRKITLKYKSTVTAYIRGPLHAIKSKLRLFRNHSVDKISNRNLCGYLEVHTFL